MKKVLLALVIMIGFAAVASAQTSSHKGKKEKMPDGVMMVDNKVMLCSNNKCTPLTETYTCSDGCKVSTDGTVTKPDGTTMKMMNGYEMDKSGKLSMIPHGKEGHVCGESCKTNGKM